MLLLILESQASQMAVFEILAWVDLRWPPDKVRCLQIQQTAKIVLIAFETAENYL